MHSQYRPGFTLIELLVVITIIVVLLSLLTPALDRAIYQADLTVCAARHRALGTGVTTYAIENRRSYPWRAAVHEQSLWPGIVSLGQPQYDSRDQWSEFLSLNKTLNCPLAAELEIEHSRDDSYVFSSFNLWFGFKYRGDASGRSHQGMLKVGDRLSFYDAYLDEQLRSPLLSSTRYIAQSGGSAFMSGTHPGSRGTYTQVVFQDGYIGGAEVVGIGAGGARYTFFRWDSVDPARGTMDLNAGYADLSVKTIVDAEWFYQDEPRLSRAPAFSDSANWDNGIWAEMLPKP